MGLELCPCLCCFNYLQNNKTLKHYNFPFQINFSFNYLQNNKTLKHC